MFQRVNDDEYGGISEILKEGFMTSFATFVVGFCLFDTFVLNFGCFDASSPLSI